MARGTRTTSLRSRNKPVSYQESTDESEREEQVAEPPEKRGSTKRSRNDRVSYREATTDESSDIGDSFNEPDEEEAASPPPTKKVRLPTRTKKSKAVKQSSQKSRATASRAVASRSTTSGKRNPSSFSKGPPPIQTDGVVRSLLELPPSILETIFEYASHPLRDDVSGENSPAKYQWLVRSALTSKGIAEIALRVLYESPPLINLSQPHALLSLLKGTERDHFIDYAARIRTLELDPMHTLHYSLPNHGRVDISELISHTPRLRDLIFIDSTGHGPHYDDLRQLMRWQYPLSLFDTLVKQDIRLRAWHWDALMLPYKNIPDMYSIHQTSAFKSLKSLSMTYYNFCSAEDPPKWSDHAKIVPSILQPLKELRSLKLTHCDCYEGINWQSVMDHVPTQLTTLTLDTLPHLHSDDMRSILQTHGSTLKELTLNHNQSLSITFFKDLKSLCPVLERLSMDFAYSGWPEASYPSRRPRFDALMLPEDLPTWPTRLERLEMFNMHHWSTEAAETFFGSLIASSNRLPNLRELILKVHLSINWRDRADFRDTWIKRLRKTFHRISKEPSRHLASYRENRLHQQRSSKATSKEVALDGDDDLIFPSSQESKARRSRRSGRIEAHHQKDEASKRQARSSQRESDLEVIERSDWKTSGTDLVQGLCNTVDVVIDNQRPSEIQFGEEDFLDSELSGDEDWQGDPRGPG
ncbi:MAG: hypothetical protein M1831_003149 [Alyxoria varia]|nr:MAG: hypothetical protein M1831_003149 [Alyxoria varia]